jgi:hypothetical protein
MGCRGGRNVKVTTHLHLVLRLRMREAILPPTCLRAAVVNQAQTQIRLYFNQHMTKICCLTGDNFSVHPYLRFVLKVNIKPSVCH